MTILLISAIALVIFLISVDFSWSNVLSSQRNNLVFEGRNLNYGAYRIRREQPRNMFIALMIVLGITGAGSAAAMILTDRGDELTPPSPFRDQIVIVPSVDIPEETPEKEQEEAKPAESKPKPPSGEYENNEPEISEDSDVKPMASQDNMSGKKPGPPGDEGDDGLIEPIENPGGGSGSGTGGGGEIKSGDPVIPDQMPEFPGGESALLAYMAQRVEFSPIDVERGVSGTLHMSFTVLSDGTITDIRTDRGIAYGENLEKKAIEAIRKMPLWKPGIKGGQPVPVRFRIPLKFVLRS